MASGVTNKMRNIHGPRTASWALAMGIKSRIVHSGGTYYSEARLERLRNRKPRRGGTRLRKELR